MCRHCRLRERRNDADHGHVDAKSTPLLWGPEIPDVAGPVDRRGFSGVDMTRMTARKIRIGFVILVATILTAGIHGEASANEAKRRASEKEPAVRLRLASSQTARLGPMRYYGGPKSPPWREVR
jgi:hypothetical protein